MDSNLPQSDSEWQKRLTSEQYKILRQKGTEPPFSGAYYNTKDRGMFLCAACGNELFSSETKYDSGSSWPSFWAPVDKKNLALSTDERHGCRAHLGDRQERKVRAREG